METWEYYRVKTPILSILFLVLFSPILFFLIKHLTMDFDLPHGRTLSFWKIICISFIILIKPES